MVDLVYYLANLIFFDVTLLYYYNNLRSSINFCHSSGDLKLSLGISLFSCSFVIVSELFCSEFPEAFIFLLAILLTVKPPAASAIF